MSTSDDLCRTCKHERGKHYYQSPHGCYERTSVYGLSKDGYANYIPERCDCRAFVMGKSIPGELIASFSEYLDQNMNEGFCDDTALENAFRKNYDKLQKFFKEQP